MLARRSLRCATLAPSSTSTLCLRSLASFTKTFIDMKGARIAAQILCDMQQFFCNNLFIIVERSVGCGGGRGALRCF
jgi:hypothetical protein